MDRLAHLNDSQREAVLTLEGPVLVLAGAGTGKTRVITHRMAEMIAQGIPGDRILSVTFTNKAAAEMLERTKHLLGKSIKPQPFISTFHSLCVRVLRQDINHLGYPSTFVIYDRGDQESTARRSLRDIKIGDKALRPGDLINIISRWKMTGITPDEARGVAENDQEFLAASAYRRYQANLRASGAVDFDDLLGLTVQLFREFPDVLAKWQDRFRYVQIDEYQDTNTMQFDLMESIVRPHRNLCVVGDDDQSIYGWRGAEVEHILGFHHAFPGAKIVRLQENYRCTNQILKLANALVKRNKTRHEKELFAHKLAQEPVRIQGHPDETIEAQTVVGEIDYLIREQNVSPNDIAILFRTNEQPRLFETELRRKHVPYVIVGAQSFFDRREIRDVMAYLKLLSQPRDEMSLLRIINVPARGIGETTVEKLLKRSVAEKKRLFEVIPQALEAGEISQKAATEVERFRGLLNQYHKQFQSQPRDLATITQQLLKDINYDGEIDKQYTEPTQQAARRESLQQVFDSLKQYVDQNEQPTLSDYLSQSTLTDSFSEPDKTEKVREKGVKLMTLHSAKGLEFTRVYLVGMEEGILPHKRSVGEAATNGNEKSIEEERRLAYVGVTRARDVLTLTWCRSRMKWGKKRPGRPSRFLFEMLERAIPPEVLVDSENPPAPQRTGGRPTR